MMRGMAAAGGEVDEERLVRLLGPDAVEPLDRLVGHRVRKVVGVLLVVIFRRRSDDLLVLRQARVPLAGSAAEDAIEVVEAPAVRPAVEWPGRALLPVGRQVPFAESGGAVAVVPEDTRQRRAVPRKDGRVSGEPARELADRAEADGVAVAPGEKRGPRGRAHRRDMEAVVPQAALGDAGVVRCGDWPAEGGGVAEAGVVDQHQQDVGRSLGWLDMPDQVPVGDRAVERPVGHPLEPRTPDRKLRAIWLAHGLTSRFASRTSIGASFTRSFTIA